MPLEHHWFRALDGCVIYAGEVPHHVVVVGIHRDGKDLWIQLAPFGESDRGLVIHCWPGQTPDEILALLRVSLRSGQPPTHMIDTLRAGVPRCVALAMLGGASIDQRATARSRSQVVH